MTIKELGGMEELRKAHEKKQTLSQTAENLRLSVRHVKAIV